MQKGVLTDDSSDVVSHFHPVKCKEQDRLLAEEYSLYLMMVNSQNDLPVYIAPDLQR